MRAIKIIATLYLALIVVDASAQEAVTNHIIAAHEYLVAGDKQSAKLELDSALRLSPNNLEANVLMGDIFSEEKRYSRAIMNYDKAILTNSGNPELFMKRADMHRILNNHRTYILSDYERALRLDPGNISYYKIKADYLATNINPETHKYDFEAASRTITEAMAIDKNNPELLFLRSRYLKGNEQFLSALADIDKAISLDPSNDKYYAERGHINFSIGRYGSARADYNKAIKINNTDYRYFEFRGHTHYNLSNYLEAYNDYSVAIDMIIAKIAGIKGRIDANDPLNKSLRLALLYRGMSLVQDNRPYDACDDFNRAYNMGESKARNYLRKYCY